MQLLRFTVLKDTIDMRVSFHVDSSEPVVNDASPVIQTIYSRCQIAVKREIEISPGYQVKYIWFPMQFQRQVSIHGIISLSRKQYYTFPSSNVT